MTINATVMRPRRVGEVLDASLKLYLRNARVLMGLAAFVVVPVQVLQAIVLLSTVSSGSEVPTGFSSVSTSSSTVSRGAVAPGAEVTVIVVGVVATALSTAACVRAVSDAYLDQPTGIGRSLMFAVRRLPALLVMEILLALGLIVGFILLVIPGIWLYGLWSVATPVLLIEATGPARALGRSRRLVRGRWWPTAGVLVTATIMATVIAGVFQGLLVGLALLHRHPSVVAAVVVSTFAGMLSAIITQPFQAAVRTILYYDLRIRREGFDLEVLAEQLGLPAASLAPTSADGDWTNAGQPGAGGQFSGGGALQPGEPLGPESVGRPGGPPFWPPPPGWRPES